MALSVHITKKLGAFRLRVDIETEREIMALLGASGCGKSMTLKCIAGIETPDSGTIVLNGRTLFDSEKHICLPPQKRRVGYLFQQYALFPNMTVLQNLVAGVREGSRRERRALAMEKLRAFGLEGLEHRKPNRLSGGQQQRVALARILLNRPEVLLLDEPFAALDSYLKWRLEMELADTLRQFSGDVLYVSHDLNEVSALCTSVCVLADGKSEEKTTVDRLLSAPETVSAALLSGRKNLAPAAREDDTHVYCAPWGLHLDYALPPSCDTVALRLKPASENGKNRFSCRVLRQTQDAHGVTLMLRSPGGQPLHMALTSEEWAALSGAETVTVEPSEILPLMQKENTWIEP